MRRARWSPAVFAVFTVFAVLPLGGCPSGAVIGGGAGGATPPGSGGAVAGTSGGAGGAGGVLGSGGEVGRSGGAGGSGGAPGAGGVVGAGGDVGTGGTLGAGGVPGLGGRAAGGGGGAVGGGTGGGGGLAATGGMAGAASAPFYLGADITNAQSASAAAQDSLLAQMKAHGFNAVRARTFVDPRASDGYDKTNGTADLAHTVTWGKKIRDTGMAYLVDFHYSDNWADPGKQCVPVAWQAFTTIAQLATAVHDYTKDAITKLIAGGARPDMVQIGNETTPGMLIHRCDSGGLPTGNNPVSGNASNWTNLGLLLKAGVAGVKEVDPGILVSLHIDRGNSFAVSKSWIDNALQQGVVFDAFGESCYQRYQGDPNSIPNTVKGWTDTFAMLVAAYPNLKFFAAEYGPLQREINDVLFNLPNKQGIGTFNWEPATAGAWNTGHALFTRSGNTYTAQPDLALYDLMKVAYASRL